MTSNWYTVNIGGAMRYIAIRFWDDSEDEDVLGTFDTEKEAQDKIDQDFESFGSQIFIREHVAYRIGFDSETSQNV